MRPTPPLGRAAGWSGPSHVMSKSPFRTFLIRAVIVFGFAVSGWLSWLAAFWFVDYAKMHGTSLRFIETVALLITVSGGTPMLVIGAACGIIAASWITRRKVSDADYHINAA